MTGKVVLLLLACFLSVSAEKKRYDGYKVFKVIPETMQEVEVLNSARKTGIELNFWNEPNKIGLPVLIMIAPQSVSKFENLMRENKIAVELTIPNVQKLLTEEEERMAKPAKDNMDWEEYHTLEEINTWLGSLEGNTNFNVTPVEVGMSFEGKKIQGVHIITLIGDTTNPPPGVILESGIHAREWITPAASSFVVNEILKDDDKDSVWHKFQYIYIPTINPDGYEYTFRHDRMWRKSRKPYLGGSCFGADLNRNWDVHWREAGASNNPCLDDYAGPEFFSETETKSISDYYYNQLSVDFKDVIFDIFISLHSYSQLLMYPWAYTGENTPHTQIWNEVAGNATEELTKVHGTPYEYGNIHDTIYPASGSSVEWFYDKFNSSFTFVFELRDRGKYGFLLPADQIIETGEELEAALKYMLTNYLDRNIDGDL